MPLNNQLIKLVENLNTYQLEELESKVEELLGKTLGLLRMAKLKVVRSLNVNLVASNLMNLPTLLCQVLICP